MTNFKIKLSFRKILIRFVLPQGVAKISKAANVADEEKSEALRNYEGHLAGVKKERDYLRGTVADADAQIPRPRNKDICLAPHAPNSQTLTMHYSFDYAQQLQYPNNPLQPGAVYFKSLRKCGLFGVNCEALGKQVNYLIDEAVTCGKGANSVISYFHHFLGAYGLGEVKLHIHADNCSGQNKNSAMIHYLLWRVMTAQHEDITLSFLIAGHTKFAPDRGFGLLKRQYRKMKVDSLTDLQKMVLESSDSNLCQLVGLENGEVLVTTYDWSAFLGSYFKKLDGILKFQHFRFSADGSVHCKLACDGKEQSFFLLKKDTALPLSQAMPPVIKPPGLTDARQWYLHEEIRPFVAEAYQDQVAPLPSVPKPSKTAAAAKATVPDASSRGRGAGARGRGRGGRGRGGAAASVLQTRDPNIETDGDGDYEPGQKRAKRGKVAARGSLRGRGRGKE